MLSLSKLSIKYHLKIFCYVLHPRTFYLENISFFLTSSFVGLFVSHLIRMRYGVHMITNFPQRKGVTTITACHSLFSIGWRTIFIRVCYYLCSSHEHILFSMSYCFWMSVEMRLKSLLIFPFEVDFILIRKHNTILSFKRKSRCVFPTRATTPQPPPAPTASLPPYPCRPPPQPPPRPLLPSISTTITTSESQFWTKSSHWS